MFAWRLVPEGAWEVSSAHRRHELGYQSPLIVHTNIVIQRVRQLALEDSLPEKQQESLWLAALWHDFGKSARNWQDSRTTREPWADGDVLPRHEIISAACLLASFPQLSCPAEVIARHHVEKTPDHFAGAWLPRLDEDYVALVLGPMREAGWRSARTVSTNSFRAALRQLAGSVLAEPTSECAALLGLLIKADSASTFAEQRNPALEV